MATAREGYFPDDADDRPGDRLLQNSDPTPSIEYRPQARNKPRGRSRPGSRSTDSSASDLENPSPNPKKFISLGAFSLIVIGIAVMFLFGVCVGFYVRELQTDKPDLKKVCGVDDDENKDAILRDKLAGYHESLVYFIRAKGITDFIQEHGVEDATTGDARDEKLADAVLEDFEKYKIGSVSEEEYDVVVTSPDPVRPNELEVLHANGSSLRHFVFEANSGNSAATNQSSEDSGKYPSERKELLSKDWKFPHVAFSPSGVVEGQLVYAHLGRETDFLVLGALGVELQDSIVIMRMGRISVAQKIRNCETHGVKGVLLYWQDGDTVFDVPTGMNSSSFVPYASAIDADIDEASIWRPSIPCQTVSAEQAAQLLTLTYDPSPNTPTINDLVEAPLQWQGSSQTSFSIGVKKRNGTENEYPVVRLSVYNVRKKRRVRNIISSIQSFEDLDRYVIIGAPRSSLPGQPDDAVVSTSILVQLSRAFRHVHLIHSWLPRRGVRLVSWGGSELSNIGMLEMIRTQHHLMGRRMVGYFDLRNLMMGNDTLHANVPASLVQLLNDVAYGVPDPKDGEQMLYMTWRDSTMKSLSLGRFQDGLMQYPFLDIMGIPTVHLQYIGANGNKSPSSLTTRQEQVHHFKFHMATTRMLILAMLGVIDTQVLPFDLLQGSQGVHDTIWQTSHALQECSQNKYKFGQAMQVCESLESVTKSFSDLAQHFLEKKDTLSLFSVNGVYMLFDRIFMHRYRGQDKHLLYPTMSDGSMAVVSELCQFGTITGDWNMTLQFHDTLTRVLNEALVSLHMGA